MKPYIRITTDDYQVIVPFTQEGINLCKDFIGLLDSLLEKTDGS